MPIHFITKLLKTKEKGKKRFRKMIHLYRETIQMTMNFLSETMKERRHKML